MPNSRTGARPGPLLRLIRRQNRHAKGIGPTLRLRFLLGGPTAPSGFFPLGGWERRRSPVPCVRWGAREFRRNRLTAVFIGCVWTRPGDRPLSYLPSHPGKAPVPCVRRGKHKPNRHVRFLYRCYSIMPNTRPGPLLRLIRKPNRQSPFLSYVCSRDPGRAALL